MLTYEQPRADLFHWLHVVLVQELYQDLAASETVFLVYSIR